MPANEAHAVTSMMTAINRALHDALDYDERVLVFGEDVAQLGVFRVTEGLSATFGDRVYDTPLAESGIVGTAIGLDSSESYWVHTPGLKVVTPSTPQDAYALLRMSIACDDPVVFLWIASRNAIRLTTAFTVPRRGHPTAALTQADRERYRKCVGTAQRRSFNSRPTRRIRWSCWKSVGWLVDLPGHYSNLTGQIERLQAISAVLRPPDAEAEVV